MHLAAYNFISRFKTYDRKMILDIGSRDINGNCRGLFPHSVFIGIDKEPGPNVDIVVAAEDFYPVTPGYDIVLTTETLEHAENWHTIITCAHRCLKRSGIVLITAAGPNRSPHSAVDGGPLRENEYYGNIDPVGLKEVMIANGFGYVAVDTSADSSDVYASALRVR